MGVVRSQVPDAPHSDQTLVSSASPGCPESKSDVGANDQLPLGSSFSLKIVLVFNCKDFKHPQE